MSKKSIIFGLLIFFMIGITLTTLSVKADAPIEMDLEYDYDVELGGPQTLTLSVWFIHGVTDPNSHYVASVAIEVNGSLVLTEYYTSQPTHNLFNYEYSVTANMEAIMNVTATCIRGGSMSKSLIVGHPPHVHLGSFLEALVPSIAAIVIVFALVYFLPYLGKKPLYRKELIVGLLVVVVGLVITIAANYMVGYLLTT